MTFYKNQRHRRPYQNTELLKHEVGVAAENRLFELVEAHPDRLPEDVARVERASRRMDSNGVDVVVRLRSGVCLYFDIKSSAEAAARQSSDNRAILFIVALADTNDAVLERFAQFIKRESAKVQARASQLAPAARAAPLAHASA